jgi:hypothetical protein
MGLLFALLACAALDPEVPDIRVPDVPHVLQEPDFCGEACVEMAARHFGLDIDQDDVFDASGLDPALGRGVYAKELRTALLNLGFDPGDTWYPVSDAVFDALIADLRAGSPSILCVHASDRAGAPEHFVLVTGYDSARDVFVYQDPGRPDGADQRLSRARLLSRWRLMGRDGEVLIRLRLSPVALTKPAPIAGFTPADYAQTVIAARERAPEGFTVVLEKPFVVVGDEEPAVLAARAENTVRFAAQGLRKNHFDHDPDKIFTAWLFKDDDSYYTHALSIFGDAPDTPYGYTDLDERALVMNIGTGGGTLIHEMVHAYIHAELPNAPPWLNEGLASLYEGVAHEDGTLRGTVNWRLPGLQSAMLSGGVPPFATLMALDEHDFYGDGAGLHYAQARYLFYWLQEHGLLERYYRAFRAATDDPTGVLTLRRTLGTDDLVAFQALWEEWVMGLRF